MPDRVIFFIYRCLQWLSAPLILLYFLNRGRKDRRYLCKFEERLGWLPEDLRLDAGGVWVHAVSVGEVHASLRLMEHLREELPGVPIFLSCGTVAGREVAEQKARRLVEGIFYAPVDYCFAVRRTLAHLRPRLVVVLETEIWPNLFREVKRTGAGLWLVNGRISDRALARYQRIRWLLDPVLRQPDRILAQTSEIAERFRSIGAPREAIGVGGNLKYDFDIASAPVAMAIEQWISTLAPKHIWIAASTMPPAREGDPDEDDAVLDAFLSLSRADADLILILAPRRPERFAEAERKLIVRGIPFVRRTALSTGEDGGSVSRPCVLLLDTIGELAAIFRLGTLIFMGGTLPHRGGHNILEPAAFDKCIVAGPHMENFAAIAAEFDAAAAWVRVAGPGALASMIAELLKDPARRELFGTRAGVLARAKQGVAADVAGKLAQAYQDAMRTTAPASLGTLLLWPLSLLWWLGSHVDRWRKRRDPRRLPRPVISVGNLTAGGTGKTPLTAWLAAKASESGAKPAILTRGYGREDRRMIVLGPGERAPVQETGDEAQAYLAFGKAVVGIGTERAEVGRAVLQKHPVVDLFLLDDGFQHHRLDRDCDLVLIDALDPVGGGRLPPAGRLREPPRALRRASAVVLTRCIAGRPERALVRFVQSYNSAAPVFHSWMVAIGWRHPGSQQRLAIGQLSGPVVAFCGLANPGSLWRTLRETGIRVLGRKTFADHHRYTDAEMAELQDFAGKRGASAIITTAKDFANLPLPFPSLGLPIWVLETALVVEDGLEEYLSGFLRPRETVTSPAAESPQAFGPG